MSSATFTAEKEEEENTSSTHSKTKFVEVFSERRTLFLAFIYLVSQLKKWTKFHLTCNLLLCLRTPPLERHSACSRQDFKNVFLIKWTGGFSQQELLSKQTQWELGLVVADGVVFVPL